MDAHPDTIIEISASLEAVCARLARLRMGAPEPAQALRQAESAGPVAALVDAVLADPRGHLVLLNRLAKLAGGDSELREELCAHARALGDTLEEPGDGYPDSADEEEAAEERAEIKAIVAAQKEAGEYESDGPSDSSDTDVEDRLTDDDAEDCLGDVEDDHAGREALRAEIRAHGMPEWFADVVREYKSENEDRWWASDEDEDEALSREAEEERESDWMVLTDLILEARAELGDAYASAHFARVDIEEDDVGEANYEAALAEYRALEEAIEARDAAGEDSQLVREKLSDTLDTYCELLGISHAMCDSGTPPAPENRPGRLAWVACNLLCDLEGGVKAIGDGVVERTAAALRGQLDLAAERQPHLKRKRAELEALDEIRAEQRSTRPCLDRDAFARLVREVGQDFGRGFDGPRFDAGAVDALQAAAEDHLVTMFGNGGLAALHAERTHLAPKDLALGRRMRDGRFSV